VLGLDCDQDAIDTVTKRIGDNPNLTIAKANFRNLKEVATKHGFTQSSGILFDLGVSSWQFDAPHRGFSFQVDAPLDMRLDQEAEVTAKDIVNTKSRDDLFEIFSRYGNESRARAIAEAIIVNRQLKPINTTKELADLVSDVYHGRQGRLHPATKVFQALRIAVNQELNNLKETLPEALSLLKPGGKIAIISFHEGEDRIVKHFLKNHQLIHKLTLNTKKPIIPNVSEINQNIRSRSAKLRSATKL
jgi:16S rRNA (cytosine1402-N4)-methyltransferase